MRVEHLHVAVAVFTLALAGCGSSRQALVNVTVSPSSATAVHGLANDTVQFTASGGYSTYDSGAFGPNANVVCKVAVPDSSRPLTAVNWTTSDAVNTSINSAGLATCIGATNTPATISAVGSGVCGGVKGTSTLACN